MHGTPAPYLACQYDCMRFDAFLRRINKWWRDQVI